MEKTCGNCGNCRSIGNCHGVCLEGYSGPLSNEVPVVLLSGSCMMVPDSWRSENEPTIEQRYQQLSEVARNLFKRTLVAYGGEDVSIVEIDDYRKQLEELGVEV